MIEASLHRVYVCFKIIFFHHTFQKLLRHKRSVSTLETQVRVLLRASIETDNTRSFLLLRVDVDAVSLEAAA